MVLQLEMEFDKDGVFRLVVRAETTNELGLTHMQTIPLHGDGVLTLADLCKPKLLKFEGVTLTADDDLIAKMKEKQAAQQSTESANPPPPIEGEVIPAGA